jgi:hypothetical protein
MAGTFDFGDQTLNANFAAWTDMAMMAFNEQGVPAFDMGQLFKRVPKCSDGIHSMATSDSDDNFVSILRAAVRLGGTLIPFDWVSIGEAGGRPFEEASCTRFLPDLDLPEWGESGAQAAALEVMSVSSLTPIDEEHGAEPMDTEEPTAAPGGLEGPPTKRGKGDGPRLQPVPRGAVSPGPGARASRATSVPAASLPRLKVPELAGDAMKLTEAKLQLSGLGGPPAEASQRATSTISAS